MELNTAKSIELGRKVHEVFGSWKAALAAAERRSDGVYVIRREVMDKAAAAQSEHSR